MMRKYVYAYAAWLAGVGVMAAVALAWYRYVEKIGLRELAERLTDTDAGNSSNDGDA